MRTTFVLLLLLLSLTATLFGQTTVSSIFPAGGLTRGNEFVHIHGTNLLIVSPACPSPVCFTQVDFLVDGGAVNASIVHISANEIVVSTPRVPHAGPVTIVVFVVSAPNTPTIVTIPNAFIYEDPKPDDEVRLLVPVAISDSGAFNTSWESELSIYNNNDEPLLLAGPTALPINTTLAIPALSSAAVTLHPPAGNAGAFLYVPRRLLDNTVAGLRVHETTRDPESWGIEVPVVPETQFRSLIVLTNVPNDARFRTLLRVYGYDANDASATLELRDETTGELLDSRRLVLQSGLSTTISAPEAPAYTQVALDPLLAPFIPTHPRIRVQIGPIFNPAIPRQETLMWGFAAITNNATQQVTTITPTQSLTRAPVLDPGPR